MCKRNFINIFSNPNIMGLISLWLLEKQKLREGSHLLQFTQLVSNTTQILTQIDLILKPCL